MSSPRHRAPSRRLGTDSAALRFQALLLVLVVNLGLAAIAGASRPGVPTAATVAAPDAPDPGAAPIRMGIVEPTPAPKPLKVTPPRAGRTTAAARGAVRHPGRDWVPTGTGMWTYLWNQTEGGDARAVVRRAKAAGLTHLYVRTGTRKGGFDGGPMLAELLPATRGTGIKVIAWDFPILANPRAEARRLAAAARFRAPGKDTPRVAAVAPDIETPAEGTRLSARNVAIYLDELRRLLPADVPIFGVIPWPSEKRQGRYPYYVVCNKVDAIVPMAYWINRDPATVTRQTMQRLKPYGKPIMPVGQAYDPRIDVPTLKLGAPSRAQVDAFLATAKKYGAPSASLWVWQFAKPAHWNAVSYARNHFDDVRLPAPR